MRKLVLGLSALVLVGAGVAVMAPREPLDLVPAFDAARLPEDPDAYLRDREAVVGGITPEAQKRILWAGAAGAILTWPLARVWAPVIGGRERCFEPVNPAHARFSTTCYPTEALLPMAALARHAAGADHSEVRIPALVLFAPADQVVSPRATKRVAAGWGGPVTLLPQVVGAGDDPWSHVIAGDILSPSITAPVTAAILGWARGF